MDRWIFTLLICLIGISLSSSQNTVCNRRGRICGINSYYCYDEFTESWICQCEVGYENTDPNRGNEFSCTDINECLVHKHHCAQNTTWCSNVPGTYHCLCIPGFTNLRIVAGKAVCSDVNECEQNPRCPDNSICANIDGSYNCTCAPGFAQGNGFCYDVDECETIGQSVCGINKICVNTVGSFFCTCQDGSLNTTCEVSPPSSSKGGNPGYQPTPDVSSANRNNVAVETNSAFNTTTKTLRELEPQNTSVFLGVGVGLGLVLLGCVFAVAYVLFVRKRRRQENNRAGQSDTSPIQTASSTSNISGHSNQTTNGSPTPGKPVNPSEHQYYTISPDPPPPGPKKTPEEIASMYSNHKIIKKPKHSDQSDDNPIVYQIFSDAKGTKDESGNPVIRIRGANPKSLIKPNPLPTVGTEKLYYATIFDNKKSKKKDGKVQISGQGAQGISATPSTDGQGRQPVKISSPRNSASTYDRLERRWVESKPAGEYHNLYDETNLKRRDGGGDTGSASGKRPPSSPYELIQIP